MASVGDQLSQMMWQMFQQQMAEQMSRASNREYLLNQYGGSMISNAMQNKQWRDANEDMYTRLLPDLEMRKAVFKLLGDLDLTGAKNVSDILGMGINIPPELIDTARQSLGQINNAVASGTPIDPAGAMLGTLPMDMISKGMQGILEKHPTDLQVANAQTARMNAEAAMLTGRGTEPPDIKANREIIDKAKARLNSLVDQYGRIRADNMDALRAMNLFTADQQDPKTRDLLSTFMSGDASLDKWLQEVGPKFIMKLNMAIGGLDPKGLSPQEMEFLAESGDVYTTWRRFMATQEAEILRLSGSPEGRKKLAMLSREIKDPMTGKITIDHGDPNADLEFTKRIFKVMIYGQ